MTKETHSQPPMANHTTVSILDLRAVLNGRVISPEDAAYDTVRPVFYGARSRRPALIVRVADATDVSHVVSLARERGLELAVGSGGHSLAGHSTTEGGIMIDLSDMKGLEIDVAGRTAWAETGLTDGELLYVHSDTHPDLFWAIRGGGGNFGVATRFKFRLHEVDTIVGGMLILPATPEVIASFVAEAEAAPEELSTIANVMVAPPMPFLPAEAHGELVIMAMMVYAGEVDEGERVVAPFRALATPLIDTVGPKPYPQMYEPMGPGPDEEVARSLFIDSFDGNAAETIVEYLQASSAPMAVAQLRILGGAMARVPVEATAFAHRRRRIMVALGAVYERREETAEHEDWVTRFAAALEQGDTGVYVNFLGDEGEARVRAAYPGSTWERLVEIKGRYDPTNLFRLNQNIPTATEPKELGDG